jgi:hypothetical protein
MEGANEIVYEGYTRQELHDAFTWVQHPENWKYPVDAKVLASRDAVDDTRRLKLVGAAVAFFTGAYPTISQDVSKRFWRVKAPGYYATVGA